MIRIDINAGNAAPRIADAIAKLQDARPLFRDIAAALEQETRDNFDAQGRPRWAPLSKATIAARSKGKGSSSVLRILQDSRMLLDSLSSDSGPDFAVVGVNRPYAAIHQFGGTIDRAAHSTKVRLRTDAKGNLVRQGTEGREKNLAVFARQGDNPHKRFRETWATVDAYQITIPARPYLPFTGTSAAATLQPEAAQSVLDAVTRMLAASLT